LKTERTIGKLKLAQR